MIPKADCVKEKIDQLGFIKITLQMTLLREWRDQAMGREKINSSNHYIYLIKIYIQIWKKTHLSGLINKKTNNTIFKMI